MNNVPPNGLTQDEYDNSLAWYNHYRDLVADGDNIHYASSLDNSSEHMGFLDEKLNGGDLTDSGHDVTIAVKTIGYNIIYASEDLQAEKGGFTEQAKTGMYEAEQTIIDTLELDVEPVAYNIESW
ncbi:hypothetical protein AAV35_011290 [Salimicrobium jeotgali]|uniref:Uncharacterized protein n=1 Tax=Salimicrobium jeotgali TaxID=1230341 RepID=K2GK67_9BACI|nr:hypothetical protein [Salimicrobium jeotgali]AKG05304.1 hypothetical protein AAV35_011290 [Salimicrobium jeotgali]EKE30829.1 hypothetical protein MJ3_11525 [Salimicrobium jeotgali]MBM7697644.1 hypothetical protein [Salimicrobium jeotgali]